MISLDFVTSAGVNWNAQAPSILGALDLRIHRQIARYDYLAFMANSIRYPLASTSLALPAPPWLAWETG